MISITSSGSSNKTATFLTKMAKGDILTKLDQYGEMGVRALAAATPRDSGETAGSWFYVVRRSGGSFTIEWHNSHMAGSVPVAILLQYGHGTGTGGYVQGRDFINPAAKPVMDQIAADVWRVVTSA